MVTRYVVANVRSARSGHVLRFVFSFFFACLLFLLGLSLDTKACLLQREIFAILHNNKVFVAVQFQYMPHVISIIIIIIFHGLLCILYFFMCGDKFLNINCLSHCSLIDILQIWQKLLNQYLNES